MDEQTIWNAVFNSYAGNPKDSAAAPMEEADCAVSFHLSAHPGV